MERNGKKIGNIATCLGYVLNLLMLLVVPFGCQPGDSNALQQAGELAIDTLRSDTLAETPTQPAINDTLVTYFRNPVDFFSLKKKTTHMHGGSSHEFGEVAFCPSPDSTAILYTYWAIEFDLKKPTERSLQFATWKPWKTKQDRSYDNNNESLVGIRCKISWSELGGSNFVGKTKAELTDLFDQPQFFKQSCLIYTQHNHCLILHLDHDVVDWFTYYHLADRIQLEEDIPDSYLSW